jgi:hypothetical protein
LCVSAVSVPAARVPTERISAALARRIALAAQGFADPRPVGRVDARHLRRVLDRTGLLQIDSVNVLTRSHYLPMFSRLGPYPRPLLDRLSWGGRRRELFEYWGHEASLLPLACHPLLRWRMQRAAEEAWDGVQQLARDRPGLISRVREMVAEQGPMSAGAVDVPRKRPSTMWDWHDGKTALEWLFYTGVVTTAARPNFARVYDLTERVLPAAVLDAPTPSREDAQRALVRIAARSLGVATESDLRDYFRLRLDESRTRVDELVEAGELVPVAVEGWRATGYLWPGARLPRRIRARALLSPFDSLIWERSRTERLFGFRYRLEIYTPATKRVHGYYVLPFLLGDRLVARVDLKADRAAGVLRVQAAYAEDGHPAGDTVGPLADELRSLAGWLALDGVAVADRGDLAAPLRAALGGAGR